MRIYPAIDLRQGRCVRLYQGNYDRETVYSDAPESQARSYQQAGAEWIHVVDLDGARSGDFQNLDAIESIARAGLRIQCGGGIRDRQGLERLFDAGVDRAVIGSLAVREPMRVRKWLEEIGGERICLALDVRPDDSGRYRVAAAGWTEGTSLTLEEGLALYDGSALRHVLCTDIARDGTLEGPAIALYREMVQRHPYIAIQASGGVRDLSSIEELMSTGVDGVIVGRALLEGHLTLEEAIACSHDG